MKHDKIELTEEKIKQLAEISLHPLFTPFPQSIEDSYKFGWSRGLVMYIETILHGNWYKWLKISNKGEWDSNDPYPQIELSPSGSDEVRKMLKKSFEPLQYKGIRSYEFLSWIGYALGISWFEKPNIDEQSLKHLYETFNFDLFLQYPSDYLSLFLAENGSSGHLDYFPTPLQITIAMNRMLECEDEVKSITDLVYEPCVGTGAMVLPSRSLNVVASDLSHLMVRAAAIQAFLYKPSMLYVPRPIIGLHADPEELRINKYFDFNVDSRIYCGDSLLGEFTCPKNIFLEGSEFVDVFFHPLDLEKHEIYLYEDELSKPWQSLSFEIQKKIVAAMAKEIQPDKTLTNPPFNAKIPKHEKEHMDEIIKRNQVFIEARKSRERLSMFQQIEEEVENKIELITTDYKGVSREQLMFAF